MALGGRGQSPDWFKPPGGRVIALGRGRWPSRSLAVCQMKTKTIQTETKMLKMFQLYYQYQEVLPDTPKMFAKKMFVLRSNENGVDSFVVIYFSPTVCHYVLLRPIHIYIHLFCCELINSTLPSSEVITFRLFTFPNKIAVSDLLPLDVVRFCKYVPPHLPRTS